ncbi:MAG: hypothetical protein Q8M26_11815 [Pseudolabrys sp.]|nr:hypothetical protein [Pseudolabrys sp.]
MRALSVRTVAAAVAMLPAVAFAQAPPETKPPLAPRTETTDPRACAPSTATTGTGQGADINVTRPAGTSLSDKLAQTGGVICPPPQIDPGMTQPPPEAGRTPVIPPPPPGSAPSVLPK